MRRLGVCWFLLGQIEILSERQGQPISQLKFVTDAWLQVSKGQAWGSSRAVGSMGGVQGCSLQLYVEDVSAPWWMVCMPHDGGRL